MGLDALPWSAGSCEEIIILVSCLRLRLYDYAGERVFPWITVADHRCLLFLESELAVAVITIDPAWGFQKGIEITQLACVCYTIDSIATNYEERKSIMR